MNGNHKASNNEIFTQDTVTKISKLLNISEDVVNAVLTAISLYIIEDASIQADESDRILLKIPKICDIEISRLSAQKRLRVDNAYFEQEFRSKLRESIYTDRDFLFESIKSGMSKLIVDKFINALDDIEREDENG